MVLYTVGRTICNAHKAHVILKKEGIHLNTDCTMKHQRKLGSFLLMMLFLVSMNYQMVKQ